MESIVCARNRDPTDFSRFNSTSPGKKKLAPLLKQAMAMNRVSGELYDGFWMDIGTPQRLIDLENHYKYKAT